MDIQALLREVEAKRQNAWRGYLFSALMGLAPLAMLLIRRYTAALLLLGLWALYYFLLARPDTKKFTAAFVRGNTLAAFSSQMDGVEYHGKAGIPREELFGDRLLPIREGTSCMTFHRITGSSRGMELELSDATFLLEDPGEKAKPQFLSGCWVRIRLDHSTGRRARLVSRGVAGAGLLSPWYEKAAGLRPIPAAGRRSETAFFAWGEGESLELTDSALDHLTALWEEREQPIAMGLEGDRLSFFLPRRFAAPGEVSVRQPVTEAMLTRSPLPELTGIIKVATACRRMDAPE